MLVLHPGLPHQLLGLFAVLLRPALKVQVVEDAHHLPEVCLLAVTQLIGEPAHHVAHDAPVFEMKFPLVVFLKQLIGLLWGRNHGESLLSVENLV